MDPWAEAWPGSATEEATARSRDVSDGKDRGRGLLGLAGLCAALWALLLTNVLDTGAPRPLSRPDGLSASGPSGSGAPLLEALVSIAAFDAAALTAHLNITISGVPPAIASGGGSGATLLLELGGATHALAWPVGRTAAFAAAARVAEVVPPRLRPFDAYSLRLGPVSAMLQTCSSGQQQQQQQRQQQQQQHEAGTAGGDCLNVALPVRLSLDARAPQGLKLAARPGAAAPPGAAEGDLLITRATSTRVLRLMAVMLQWIFATYVAAWCAGSIMARYVLRRCFGRLHYGLV
jgi:hypothetical protein